MPRSAGRARRPGGAPRWLPLARQFHRAPCRRYPACCVSRRDGVPRGPRPCWTTGRACPRTRRPRALRPVELVRRQRACPRPARTSSGLPRRLHRVGGTARRTRAPAASSAIGLIVPSSLLVWIRLTTAIPSSGRPCRPPAGRRRHAAVVVHTADRNDAPASRAVGARWRIASCSTGLVMIVNGRPPCGRPAPGA